MEWKVHHKARPNIDIETHPITTQNRFSSLSTINQDIEEHKASVSYQAEEYVDHSTDKHGSLLVQNIQVVRKVTLPIGTEMMVACHVAGDPARHMGMIEGKFQPIKVAASLHQIGADRRLWSNVLIWKQNH